MKYKVSELDGDLLDAAVAKAEGLGLRLHEGRWQAQGSRAVPWYSIPRYYTDWAAGGPLIERERIEVRAVSAILWHAETQDAWYGQGPTILIAAMRARVARKFAYEVELP